MFSTSTRTAFAMHIFPLISLLAVSVQAFPAAPMDSSLLERDGAQTYSGCYSSSDPLSEFGTWQWQSTGYCGANCTSKSSAVLGLTNGNDCWCGSQLPASDSKVDDSKCNTPCAGYGSVMCGANGFWSIYLTGLDDNVSNVAGSGSSSSQSSSTPTSTEAATSAAPTSHSETTSTSGSQSVVTSVAPGTTIVVTQPAEHAPTSSSSASVEKTSHHSSNTAGIAAGVVVGIVAFAAIVAGVFFFLRHRRRRMAEEDYKRSTQVQDFMRNTTKEPPGTSYSAASDSRLDPTAGRRNSVGSLADNQDYSRRILRVANPDGH